MDGNAGPQKQPDRCAPNADANEVQHGERAVGQHSIELLCSGVAGPASHTEPKQSDARKAAHHCGNAAYLDAE